MIQLRQNKKPIIKILINTSIYPTAIIFRVYRHMQAATF